MAFSSLSQFLFPLFSRSSLARSFRATSSFVSTMLFSSCTILIRVRRYLFTCYTWETLLNHVFEDLRKTKAPNNTHLGISNHTTYVELNSCICQLAIGFLKTRTGSRQPRAQIHHRLASCHHYRTQLLCRVP
jgi:hypothetical protein